ncbi:MAG: radical SAM protein [Firmicutes bacterium]|nr:radical SAM protein [Bacillota bacterium]
MKRHAIIPIFIPHRGCPNDCVFCNQRKITASSGPVTKEEVREKIDLWLSTLTDRPGLETVEIAFYGGSFTGIPVEEQNDFLTIAKEYKDRGLVQKIHLSTRPDYIDEMILNNLKRFSVDVIELGVQSFDEDVLKASRRGHDAAVVERSAKMIKERGFTLGIQLMIGLPGDSYESCITSAVKTTELKPDIARLYPTVIIRDTELYDMWERGEHRPPEQEEIVRRTAHMYRILTRAGINVIRVGLKRSDLINDAVDAAGGTYHPAVRQLVCGYLARETLEQQLAEIRKRSDCRRISFYANGRSMSDMIGWQGENKTYFKETYPQLSLRFEKDDSLADDQYVCREKE